MQADYWSAQYDADTVALQHFATNMAIPWAQFKADLAVVRHDWWETQRDAYLAWCASIAAAEAAFQTLVGAAWSARSSTMGAADTVYVSTLANADETQFVSTSQADEVYVESMAGAYQTYQASLALADRDFTVNVAAAQRNFDIDGNQAVFDSAVAAATATRAEACRAAGDAYGRTRVAADDQRRVAQAQAQFVYAQAAGPANVAWVESYAAAKLTYVTAQGTAHVASVTDVANDRTAYRTQEATSLASVMVVFATAHPSPWASYTRDTIDAWRDLVVATAPAEAAYEIALATSQAASEIAQTVAENTFDIAVAQAGAQEWLAAAQAGLDQANGERQADVAFAAAAGQAAPQGLPGKQPQPPSPPPPPLQPGAPVPTPAQVTAETYGAGQGQSGTVGSTASVSMEAPDPNAVEPVRTPSNRGSSADDEKNPPSLGSSEWLTWKLKRNGGSLRAGMRFNESNKRVAEGVQPVLNVTGDVCLSVATGPFRDIIEIGTGKDMWDDRELTRTEIGVRVGLTFGVPVAGIFLAKAFSVGSKVARAVHRAEQAGETVEEVLESGVRIAPDLASTSRGAGMSFDEAGRLTNRATALEVLKQGPNPTCGPVSCAIIAKRLGRYVDPENYVAIARQKGWLTDTGMHRGDLVKLLREFKIRAEEVTDSTIDVLRQATTGRNWTIARYKPGASGGAGHFVVIDGITKRFNPVTKAIEDVVAITNPHGSQYYLSIEEFLKVWDNSMIRIID